MFIYDDFAVNNELGGLGMFTAMVISPHADDAAAFCGGTVANQTLGPGRAGEENINIVCGQECPHSESGSACSPKKFQGVENERLSGVSGGSLQVCEEDV